MTTLTHQWDVTAVQPGLDVFPETERAARSAAKMAEDREDLEKERGGVNVKRSRFFGEQTDVNFAKGNGDSQLAMAAMADMTAQAYQQNQEIHDEFMSTSSIEREALQDVLLQLQEEQEKLKQRYAELETNALMLSDGVHAYVGENGQYVDVKGNALSEEQQEEAAALHQEKPDATTHKEMGEVVSQWTLNGERINQVKAGLEMNKLREQEANNLKEQMDSGEISPEEYQEGMERLTSEKQQMLQDMDPEVREMFEQRVGELTAADHSIDTPKDDVALSHNEVEFSLDDLAESTPGIVHPPISIAGQVQSPVFENTVSLGSVFAAQTQLDKPEQPIVNNQPKIVDDNDSPSQSAAQVQTNSFSVS